MAVLEQSEISSYAPVRGERADDLRNQPKARRLALRTAFVSRFIVLREARRSKAHRIIEAMEWDDSTTAEDLYDRFRAAFITNGDKLEPVDRDLRRALQHAYCSIEHFVGQYVGRSANNFTDALKDYKRSNILLFGEDEEIPVKTVGWRLP
ncbi:MAG TPA: hypothetical protein PKA63_08810 [Oligoflexia bacterium]|nr:hypothetical protein [Oligoflexia bacterium]HMP48751.1 hypothetical protein [Oligoflexia bacterium]